MASTHPEVLVHDISGMGCAGLSFSGEKATTTACFYGGPEGRSGLQAAPTWRLAPTLVLVT